MDQHLNDEEREKLRLENEIRKIKLSLETGAQFMEDPEMPGIPPELENEFLNYIEQFETMHADSPRISVYDKIGRPEFKKVADLDDADIETELDDLFDLLLKKGIGVDAIYEVDDREMYRFITEDLFHYEMYVMPAMEGMMSQFTYEEFYPNDDEDIRQNALNFYEAFLDLNKNFFTTFVRDENNPWFENFRNAYMGFEPRNFEVINYTIQEEHVLLHFNIDFLAFLDERQTHHFNGKGSMTMDNDGYWSITNVEFPEAK